MDRLIAGPSVLSGEQTMLRKLAYLILLVFAFAVATNNSVAQDSDARIVGVWHADFEKSAAVLEDAELVRQFKAAAAAGLQIEMTFRADKIALATIKAPDKETKLTGKWSVVKSGDGQMDIKLVDDESGVVDNLKIVFLEKNLTRIKKESESFAIVFRRRADK